jgi:GT2 family glycosyltransferase
LAASVIIITYNQANLLKRALEALSEQTTDDFDIIVVDDGSTDSTALLCKNFSLEIPNLTYIGLDKELHAGPSKSANIGIRASSGEYILFTDSDCVAEKNWVELMVKSLSNDPVIAGSVASPTSDYIMLCHNVAQFHCFLPEMRRELTEFIAGANMGIRKSVLMETGMFDEGQFMAQDMEWLLRARTQGFQPIFEPAAMITHIPEGRSRLRPVLNYATVHAESTIRLRIQYSNLLKTPFILKSPMLLLFMSPVIAIYSTIENFLVNPRLFRYLHTFPVILIIRLAWCKGAIRGLNKMIHEK